MIDPTEAAQVEVREGDILDGKYRVERVLGAGGMGVVVAAQHTVLNNRVALKFLLPSVSKNEQTSARFLREAQAAVKIKSPHVARVIDVGTMADSGSPYMVMEFLEGRDLGSVIEAQGSLDVELACLYTLQACEALAAAHAVGIIHRDIKPANLYLTVSGDGAPVLKVLDFGISKNVDMAVSNLTQTQMSMGSPLYMSPEQMRSARDVDARTDVWSLGVVLFEMLTGQLPFMADTMPQLCALVLEENAPLVSQLRRESWIRSSRAAWRKSATRAFRPSRIWRKRSPLYTRSGDKLRPIDRRASWQGRV
jgi:serine/threonine-protein kinase